MAELRSTLFESESKFNSVNLKYSNISADSDVDTAYAFITLNLIHYSDILLSYIFYMQELEPTFNINDIIGHFRFRAGTDENQENEVTSVNKLEDGRLSVEFTFNSYPASPRYLLGDVLLMNDYWHPQTLAAIQESFKKKPFKDSVKQGRYFAFDYILKDFTPFNQLSPEVKSRIVSLEFINKQNKDIQINEENYEKIIESLRNGKIKEAQRRLDNHKDELNHLRRRTEEILENYNREVEIITGITHTDYDISKIKKVLNDNRIQHTLVDNEQNLLKILTRPIMLNYDENKKDTNNKLKALKKTDKLTIGMHEITIGLSDLNFRFNPVNNVRNHHIERYTCYGNFTNPINDAREANNIAKIISLTLQMLSHITIGDPAGNETIKEAIIVDKTDAIIHPETGEIIHHTLYFKEDLSSEGSTILKRHGILDES